MHNTYVCALLIQVTEKKTKPHIQVDIGGGQMKTFAPEEISAMVLVKMKETAEAYLGKKVNINSVFIKEKALLKFFILTEANIVII